MFRYCSRGVLETLLLAAVGYTGRVFVLLGKEVPGIIVAGPVIV